MARQMADVLNTTTLVHRGDRDFDSWWRTAAICDLPGVFRAEDIPNLHSIFDAIKRMGFDAFLFRPAHEDLNSSQEALRNLVTAAHEAGLKLIARVVAAPDGQATDPTATPPAVRVGDDHTRLLARTRTVIEAGVDGVDVGLIWDDPESASQDDRAEEFSRTIDLELAEIAASGKSMILAGEATKDHPRFFERHVRDEWFHHLRDDALYGASWDAEEIKSRVRETYQDRDPLGHAVPWRPSIATWSSNPRQRRPLPGSWEDQSPAARSAAMTAFATALPGAIYLPFLRCGGSIKIKGTESAQINLGMGERPKDRFRRGLASSLLHLRAKYQLGSATLAFIDGLSWCHPGVVALLSGPVMVVLNTSTREVVVPSRHTPLVYSGGFLDSTEAGTNVEPESCAWFLAGRPEPVDPAIY